MTFPADLAAWWAGGGIMMPAMLAVSLVLYHLIGLRAWALYGPPAQRFSATRMPAADLPAGPAAAWAEHAAALAVEAELSRALGVIRALIAALPLLGLLGTVTGMIATFAALGTAQAATGGIGVRLAASGGIGMALTATQYGMALAVPAMVCEWLLRRRVTALTRQGARPRG